MNAQIIKFGDSPPGLGGQYERKVIESLSKVLSPPTIMVTNPCFPQSNSFFYEYDIILLNPYFCEIIEVKYLFSPVKVYDDWLESINNFLVPGIFSTLETKAKVLKSKFRNPKDKLFWEGAPWVRKQVIVGPDDTQIQFKYKDHEKNETVIKLNKARKKYKLLEKQNEDDSFKVQKFKKLKNMIIDYSNNLQDFSKRSNKIGRFHIKRETKIDSPTPEYWACDEHPCPVDVHLKEFPFNPNTTDKEIQNHLTKVTYGMQILRNLRHQYIHCVIGHFQTGYSLVQVSDWFDGYKLENKWDSVKELVLFEKIILMVKIAEGIGYCHNKGVFHRNISADNILLNEDFDDVKISGFDFARDIDLNVTLTNGKLLERDENVITPEEIIEPGDFKNYNFRLYDIYQLGLLFYRILENGRRPFSNVLDYCTSPSFDIPLIAHAKEKGIMKTQQLICEMIDIKPKNRIDPIEKIIDKLNEIILLF